MTVSRTEVMQTALSGLAGWATLLAALAALVFSSSHEPPTLGYVGAFEIWSLVLSLFYVGDFVVIVALYYLALRPWVQTLSSWVRALIGAGLFCMSVPLFSMAGTHLRWQELLFCCGLAATIGFVCFLVLCRSIPEA